MPGIPSSRRAYSRNVSTCGSSKRLKLGGHAPLPALSRRNVLVGGAGLAGVLAVDALLFEPSWLDVVEFNVPVPGLARELDGFTIAQITDAHLTVLGKVEESILQHIAQRGVHLVVLTGDIIDSTARLAVLKDVCRQLRSTGADVIASLGNWEHWGKIPAEDLVTAYRDAGVKLLVNEELHVRGVRIFATDDATAGKADLRQAAVRSRGLPQVLLTHSPAALDEMPGRGGHYDLALAGHTHGGQLRLSSQVVPFVPPGSGRFIAGWYETSAGPAYVSRGTGTSVLPARFMCRPELPIFRLRQG